ncbi:bifunctional 3-phosphoshikimate 1-carboxyvinyltransferase/cytidylate kinase [Thauera chlorobenzoica]|uniref:Multifunctional fusion protein n=1 Tax=Thauera chlorobenzoica TaxID=96773 RepID=A0A1H5SAQ3_9RHOO|nr:bifunctional 3-phosphoshikimate 1-carboxyvinyltransferase/cytidylate kinase [Thauera chlorobenzoica]APR04898.1 3-phosphoshikimate 1-carboxyvinyltransferase/cytidylate kinase [Thauera chlorobenzoica]SEF47500.1 3-phosphoshikimate 1-carboxyvinyltransferase [Thauera chlorobenzoica]
MEFLDLPPMLGAAGRIRLPGSKSISNRVLLLAALAEGETEIRDLLLSDDVERMLEALRALGVAWKRDGDSLDYRVRGVGGPFPVKAAELFLGNAGTAFRPLTAALALSGGEYRLSGVARMHERPIGDLVDALRQLGADITCTASEGYPPLHLRPATICPGGVVKVRGDVSSQFLTALLMALPLTGVETTLEVVGELISKPYVRITLELMARFGVEVEQHGWTRFVVPGGACYRSPGTVFVEGDASSASYFLAAGAIGGGPLRVEGVGRSSIQGDVRFAEALGQLGAKITMGDNWIEAAAPDGGVLKAFDLDLNHIPDAAMTLAVLALFADGPCRLRNIASWRVKETDRIAAMATELRKLGAEVEEGADYLTVSRPARLRPAAIDTYDDHRIAMCFSLVSLGACRVRINDPRCVNKTFPGYFDAFAQVARPVPVLAIDGPSASGKGTVAARVAAALGWHYLDSGSLYRLVALAAMRAGVPLDDERGVAALAAALPASFEDGRVLLSGEDVTDGIRSEACSVGASKVAVLAAVRAALFDRQRDYRAAPGLVAEGRDMGSVVFPDAGIKVFLTASAEARAERRYKQLIEKGSAANMESLLKDLQERDARDAARPVAPLLKLPDAVLLDTTERNVEQAVAFVLDLVRAGGEAAG